MDFKKWRNAKWKYWILTVKDINWKPPATIDTLSNVKYIKGQLKFCESQYIYYWQIAVQYFDPIFFTFVKEQFQLLTDPEPLYSLAEWVNVWALNTSCSGAEFELGNDSDLSKRNSQTEVNPFIVESRPKLNMNNLEKRLLNIVDSLYDLPLEFLDILWKTVQIVEIDQGFDVEDYVDVQSKTFNEAHGLITPTTTRTTRKIEGLVNQETTGNNQDSIELEKLIRSIGSTNLEDYDDMDSQTMDEFHGGPLGKRKIQRPKNHGKKWQEEDIQELDKNLRLEFMNIQEIAKKLNRTKKSIEFKACERVIALINAGMSAEKAIQFYGNKVSMAVVRDFISYKKEQILKRKNKRNKIHH